MQNSAPVIHAFGTLAGTFNRRQTGKFRWNDAGGIATRWEAAGKWDGSVQPPEPPPPIIPRGVTIAEATEAYLAKCMNRGIQPAMLPDLLFRFLDLRVKAVPAFLRYRVTENVSPHYVDPLLRAYLR